MIPHDYFIKVKNHFQGDNDKALNWFNSHHCEFGILTPMDMLKLGREKTIMTYINKHF